MIYKIETDVPMPGTCSPDMVDAILRLASAEIGSSVFFPKSTAQALSKDIVATMVRTGSAFSTQEVLDGTKVTGTRVWRRA
jgi:hypothetical protein